MTGPWFAALRQRCTRMTAEGFLTANEALALLDIAEAAQVAVASYPFRESRTSDIDWYMTALRDKLAEAANSQEVPRA